VHHNSGEMGYLAWKVSTRPSFLGAWTFPASIAGKYPGRRETSPVGATERSRVIHRRESRIYLFSRHKDNGLAVV
jgi:hypothetical protein